MITGEDIRDAEEEDMMATLLATTDPHHFGAIMPGQSVPALTILLLQICKNDPNLFQEATRLVCLFIKKDREIHARGKR